MHARADLKIQCPYCFEKIWMEFYPEEGETQDTIIDCEVCCQPIRYEIYFEASRSKPRVQISKIQ